MQAGQLLMTQADRDRLVTLRKAKRKLITQRKAAEELELSVRQVKRLRAALKKRGKAVIRGLRGKPEAVQIFSAAVYGRFKPTVAAEHLRQKQGIEASKETAMDDPRQAVAGEGRLRPA